MENHYEIINDTAIIAIPYKNDIVHIYIDKDDLKTASSINGKWIMSYRDKNRKYFYVINNLDKSISLHRLILGVEKESLVYFKDDDRTNLRKSNLTINTYEASEAFKLQKKRDYHNMTKEVRDRFLQGMKEKRYNKSYSDKLAEGKKGTKNPISKVTPQIVNQIREEYYNGNVTQQLLANEFGIHRATVADILNYRTWNELDEDTEKEYRVYKENRLIPFTIKFSDAEYRLFTNEDILYEDFVLVFENTHVDKYMFCQKIGMFKLYVELRNKDKEFLNSFEVVFPEYIRKQNINNYVIIHQKPKKYISRHTIHEYMKIISTHLFYDIKEISKPLLQEGN